MQIDPRFLLTMACSALLLALMAHWPARAEQPLAPAGFARAPQSQAGSGLGAAVRLLDQAALQRPYASNGQLRAMLQAAHGRLQPLAQNLHGAPAARVAQLDRDVLAVLALSDQYAPLASVARPAQPGAGGLLLLAREAQELWRDEPALVLDQRIPYWALTGPADAGDAAPSLRAAPRAADASDPWPAAPERAAALPLLRVDL